MKKNPKIFLQHILESISEIEKYNLKGIVNIYGGVPREEALKMQKESQILLLLLCNNIRRIPQPSYCTCPFQESARKMEKEYSIISVL